MVENVKSYYTPFIKPQVHGRHCFWANFHITAPHVDTQLFTGTREDLVRFLGFDYEGNIYYDGNNDPLQVLRNCVAPELGRAVLDSAQGTVDFEHMQESLL